MNSWVVERHRRQIAHDIGIAESTVKVHRTNLMRKMKARSLPELSRMADMLKDTSNNDDFFVGLISGAARR
jgi:FixJ family two-component response regulator